MTILCKYTIDSESKNCVDFSYINNMTFEKLMPMLKMFNINTPSEYADNFSIFFIKGEKFYFFEFYNLGYDVEPSSGDVINDCPCW
jgi:hypothetical protein